MCVCHLVLHVMIMHTIFFGILYLSSFYKLKAHHASYVHVIVLYTSCTTPLSTFPSSSTSPLAYPLHHTKFHRTSLSFSLCTQLLHLCLPHLSPFSSSPPFIMYFMSFILYTHFSMALTY